MTPITTSIFIELELVLTAEFTKGENYIEAGHQTIDDDILDNVDIEDIKLNGVSILPKSASGDTYALRLVQNLLTALGDSINEPLFAQADKDAE